MSYEFHTVGAAKENIRCPNDFDVTQGIKSIQVSSHVIKMELIVGVQAVSTCDKYGD